MKRFKQYFTEGLRHQKTYTHGDDSANLYKDHEWDEYRVKYFKNGKHLHKADSHHSDKEDAHSTAQHQVKNLKEDEYDNVPHGRTLKTSDWAHGQKYVKAKLGKMHMDRAAEHARRASQETYPDMFKRRISNFVHGRPYWEVHDKNYKAQRMRAAKRTAKSIIKGLNKDKAVTEDNIIEISNAVKNSYVSKAIGEPEQYIEKARQARRDRLSADPNDVPLYKQRENNMVRKSRNRDNGINQAITTSKDKI